MKGKVAGFSLIELLIVIAILSILTMLAFPNLIEARNRADDMAAKAYLHEVAQGVEVKRYSSSFVLPPVQPCASLADKPADPGSVTSCAYQPLRRDSFTVTVTSKSGSTFRFDGFEIDQLP